MKFEAARMPHAQVDPVLARHALKRALCATFRLFARHGFNEGVAGHVTARDPVDRDCFWVNPFGAPYALMRPDRLSCLRRDGTLLEGAPVNAAAFAIHAAIHQSRPEIDCVAHGHPLYGKAWSTLGRLLAPVDHDVCTISEDHVIYARPTGLVTGAAEAMRIAQALGSRKAIILPNHGILTVGRRIEEAAWWFFLMERSCQVQILSRTAGGPNTLISPEDARAICAATGTPEFGWFQAQPIFEVIYADNPDLRE